LALNLEIWDVRAEFLPELKLEVVRQLKSEGRNVMVVGDGVNDAPALAAGNLGVAMGALGSDVAIQTADIALMASDLKRVPHFMELSKRTLHIINQNMLCGFVFLGSTIDLSGIGLIPPIAAAFIHEFGAVLCHSLARGFCALKEANKPLVCPRGDNLCREVPHFLCAQ
jgi:Cd2+/Zn2+-exporting ATPase